MLKLSCLCGQVRIKILKRPDFINECNCTLCSKSGARWAYFHPSEVGIEGTTKGYSRGDKEDPAAEIQFCANCGSTTHFILTESAVSKFGNSEMGVNVRLADEKDLAGSPGTGIPARLQAGRLGRGERQFSQHNA